VSARRRRSEIGASVIHLFHLPKRIAFIEKPGYSRAAFVGTVCVHWLLISDPRIKQAVRDIDQEVQQDHD
jgi:hypothetical protein